METTPMNSSFKISPRFGSQAAPRAAKKGFTLIELLVVITIIAVLAGLLFPAMGAVRTQARKASAKNDVTQIVNAIKAFYLEYGRYPDADGKVNAALLKELTGGSASDVPTINKRQIRFLEVPPAKSGRGGLVGADTGKVSGGAEPGEWADPWGYAYEIKIDKNYSGQIATFSIPKHTGQTGAAVSSGELKTEVVAYSKGKPEGTTPDPVMSWK